MKEDWPGAEQFTNYLRPSLTLKELARLREFYMAQQVLAQELLEAKYLGTCKITTSGKNPMICQEEDAIQLRSVSKVT